MMEFKIPHDIAQILITNLDIRIDTSDIAPKYEEEYVEIEVTEYDKKGRVKKKTKTTWWSRLPPATQASIIVAVIGALGIVSAAIITGILKPEWISIFRPTPTPTPTSTPTLTPTPTATPILTPTPDPYETELDCDDYDPPCQYRIRHKDTFFLIAIDVYTEMKFAPVIMSYNRDNRGYKSAVTAGEFFFIPSLDNLPPLPYPECVQGEGIFPCLYTAYRGDTYETLAQEWYSNEAVSEDIEDANFEFSARIIGIVAPEIIEGLILVLPSVW